MATRIQSPNSINTYKRCPRKYYYEYILNLKAIPSIHLIRGKITHSTLEDFFKLNVSFIDKKHYEFELNVFLINILKKHWQDSEEEIRKLNLEKKEFDFYFRETVIMLENWFRNFIKRLNKKLEKKDNLAEAFNSIKPMTETHIISSKHMVQGFLDTIYNDNDEIFIIDYKTSKRPEITKEYKLQLAIYSLLYYEKYGVKPKRVGIDFLRHDIQFIDVDQQLMDLAEQECKLIQEKTISDSIEDYPKKESNLCQYGNDCCKHYEKLVQQRSIKEFTKDKG